jgi:PAS domain S-box-containing protein
MKDIGGFGMTLPNSGVFERFFKYAELAMYISTREGNFLEVNLAMEKLLGYERGELLGVPVIDTFAQAADRDPFRAEIEMSGVVHQYPLMLRKKSGETVPCFIDAVTWNEGDGVGGYHGVIRAGKKTPPAKKQTVTILFFDIRNSTGIAEGLEPELFAEFLNDILKDIMDLIYGCGGQVNKMLGDGLMAVFGAPQPTGRDALNAVEAAREIQNYLAMFNDVRPDYLAAPVAAGVGIATGTVFAGIIGSVRRREYTVLGDAVNIASRLEGLTHHSSESVLMDEATWQAVKDAIPCRRVFKGKVRGRETDMFVYGLLPPQ